MICIVFRLHQTSIIIKGKRGSVNAYENALQNEFKEYTTSLKITSDLYR